MNLLGLISSNYSAEPVGISDQLNKTAEGLLGTVIA